MPNKLAPPTTPSELLAAIADAPARHVAHLAAALRGPAAHAIEAALREPGPLRDALRRAVGDLDALGEAPWLVQYAARVDLREASPELVRVARADAGAASEQAAQVLLGFFATTRDGAALEAVASDVARQRGLMPWSVRALFALGDEVAWSRLADDAAAGGATAAATLWHLAGDAAIVAREPRWIGVARAALRTGRAREAARAVLTRALTPSLRRALFAGEPPAVVAAPAPPEALAAARAAVDALLAKLPCFAPPAPATRDRLDALDALLGCVPPSVRALHERIDGLDAPGATPRDRVRLYDTATILEDAMAWDRANDPRNTPRDLVAAFLWPVAPDGATNAGLSGGPPLGFELPADAYDPVLTNAAGTPAYSSFVARALRRAARNASGATARARTR